MMVATVLAVKLAMGNGRPLTCVVWIGSNRGSTVSPPFCPQHDPPFTVFPSPSHSQPLSPPVEKDCPSISVWDCTGLWNLGLDINGAASILFDTNPLTNLCIQSKIKGKQQLLLHTTDYCCAVFWHQLLTLFCLLSAPTITQNS